ncbi:hypothetical protein Y032_0003g1643 [Ancylostoma ceylanicum]|uniref:Uncharacterized protein n=1 Tax=Ancylostoma ceylanicum TaxID=53326 RepID=A0A016VYV5_9BILA|nr:hypothetical protein Y032_0003g1643 [Ancylostoma ceylanicum]
MLNASRDMLSSVNKQKLDACHCPFSPLFFAFTCAQRILSSSAATSRSPLSTSRILIGEYPEKASSLHAAALVILFYSGLFDATVESN